MAPKTNPGSKSAADNMTPEQLERALYVSPPPDPQQLEEHVRQLLMRAQVSWLPKRDILDILTNWREYSLPISLMPPDQPGRATRQSSRIHQMQFFMARIQCPACSCAFTAFAHIPINIFSHIAPSLFHVLVVCRLRAHGFVPRRRLLCDGVSNRRCPPARRPQFPGRVFLGAQTKHKERLNMTWFACSWKLVLVRPQPTKVFSAGQPCMEKQGWGQNSAGDAREIESMLLMPAKWL